MTATMDATTTETAVDLPPSFGALACAWIEACLIHTEGDFYGEPFKLTDFQRWLLWRWYEYEPDTLELEKGTDGRDRIKRPPIWANREMLLGLVKGEGKTELFAALACLELAGPTQLSPLSPVVVIAAAAYDQAALLYKAASIMLTAPEAPLCQHFQAYEDLITFRDGRPGKIQRVAAVAGTNDGPKPTLFIGDELHEWTGKKRRVYVVLKNGTRKRRNGRTVTSTTAGVLSPEDAEPSLCELAYYQAIDAYLNPERYPRLLAVWFEASDRWDLSDRDQRRQALLECSPSAGVLYDIEERVDAYDDALVDTREWLRYFANVWLPAIAIGDNWLSQLDDDHWDNLAVAPELLDHLPPPGARCWAGVDMALKHDSLSVAVLWELEDGRLYLSAYIQHRQPGVDRLDHIEPFDLIRWIAANYELVGLAYDPRFFELPAQMLAADGINVIEWNQTPERMQPACSAAYVAIADRDICHDGNRLLASHIAAGRRRNGERGFTLGKLTATGHIDGCIAFILAKAAHDLPEPEPDHFIFEVI